MSRSPMAGVLMVGVAGVCFGAIGVFNRDLLAHGLTVPQMLLLRFGVGAIVMWTLAALTGAARKLDRATWVKLLVLGVLYVVEAWLYFESSNRIPVALTALLLYLYPTLVAALSAVLFKERLGVVGVLALVLSSVGIALAVGAPSDRLDVLGIVFGVGTAIGYGFYVLLSGRVGAVPGLFSAAIVMTVAAVLFAIPVTLGPAFTLAPVPLSSLAGLVVLCTVIPIPLVLLGVPKLGAARASIISTLEPLSAALCGYAFLNETLNAVQWLGAGLVLTAVVALAWHTRRVAE